MTRQQRRKLERDQRKKNLSTIVDNENHVDTLQKWTSFLDHFCPPLPIITEEEKSSINKKLKDDGKSPLPSWFFDICEIYTEGGHIYNPFYRGTYTNPVWLNPIELSVYDYIKGCEILISGFNEKQFKTPQETKELDELITKYQECLIWFRKNDGKKYLTLLD